ncbi:MAG: FtsQ-type POTRA domain-containing protein [Thermoleophilia bacterium]|nr:FtsQ-type POTRA domain-containing protein [Thermoleophilia bacterium]
MDDRVRDRRRSVTRQRGRRRGTLLAIAAIVIIAGGLFLWLRSSDVFAVKQINATVTLCVTQEEVAQATSGAMGASLLTLSTDELERRLRGLPYVRSAQVYREFPNTLEVRLVEYEPVARLQGEGESIWLVSDDGRVLEKAQAPRGVNLPLVVPTSRAEHAVGEKVSNAVLGALPVIVLLQDEEAVAGLPKVGHVAVSAAGALVLQLDGGAEVRLGEPDRLEYKLRVAAELVERYLRDEGQIEYVDVTVPERPAVKPK